MPESEQDVRELQAMAAVRSRLNATLGGRYAEGIIEDTLTGIYRQFDGRPVRDFVPILVERMAREGLASQIL